MTSLPLTLEKRYSVLLPPTVIIRILLVGVGGTGSWLALSLGRLAYHARQKGITFHLTFVDPDRVAIKNVGRQAYKLFGIEGHPLHDWRAIQYGGDTGNEYRNRWEKFSLVNEQTLSQAWLRFEVCRGLARNTIEA